MSRKAIIRVVAVYFGVAAVFAAVVLLATPGMADWRASVIIGSFAGIALLAPALAGILPLIFWAFGRFRADKAAGPVVAWGLLGGLLFLFSTLGDAYEGNLAIRNIPANISAMFSNDYETFIRVVKTSCVESRNRNSTDRQTGISDAAFAAFCQCYAEVLLKELTVQEFRITLDARVLPNPPPVWIREKMGRAAIACRSLAVSH